MKNKLSTAAILFAVGITLTAGALAQEKTPAPEAAKTSTTSTHHKAAAKTAHHKTAAKTTKHEAAAKTSAPLVLDTQKAKASYAIGNSIAKSLKRDGIDVDSAIVLRGMNDVFAGNPLLLTDEEAKATITTLQQEARAKREAAEKELSEANEKDGAAFLASNKTKEGVVTLPSGLQYKVVKQGDGPKPLPTDTVVCNYRGTFINGKEFDSSDKHGHAATFPVSGVIKGWTEVLQLMPVGSNYQVYIPAELAYGKRANPEIGPNATLIFDIELLSIKEKPADATAPAHGPATATEPSTAKPAEAAK